MASFNIYGYDNASENPPLLYTVVLSEDESKVVSVVCDDAERKENVERTLADYMAAGLPATDAVFRLAGSYGDIKDANPDGTLMAAAPDEALV